MKKWIALVLALLLCLSLAACGEDSRANDDEYVKKTDKMVERAELYKKYEELITALENKDYSGVINQIASLSHAEKEASKEPGPAPQQVLCQGGWFSNENEPTVVEMSFRPDGICVVDGTEMNWVENNIGDDWMGGYILHDGTAKYIFEVYGAGEDRVLSCVNLWTAKETEYGTSSDKHLGNFYNHEMIPTITDSWNQLTLFEDLPMSVYLHTGYTYIFDEQFNWAPVESGDGLLTVNAWHKEGTVSTQYTMTLTERDGHTVLMVTNRDTGTCGLYYNETFGYEETWEEAIYARAVDLLDDYVRGYSIYLDGEYVSNNRAREYIFGLFTQVEGYLDAADYLARFTVLPHRLTSIVRVDVNQLDQESRNNQYSCGYQIDGKLDWEKGGAAREKYGMSSGSSNYYTYDDTGRISLIHNGWSREDISSLGTPVYDEAGNLISISVQTGSGAYTVSYTYDDAGRLTRMEYQDYSYTYTYDENGMLISKKYVEEGFYTGTTLYTYENGLLTQEETTYKYWYSTPIVMLTVYSYDDQGNITSGVVTSTDPDYSYKSTTIEYNYQDIYFLNTDGLLETE